MAPKTTQASSQSDAYNLHSDNFLITALNPEGKKFASVNRLAATGESFAVEMLLDYNSDLLRVDSGDRIGVCISETLDLAGGKDDGTWDQSGKNDLSVNYDYVMYGTIYEVTHTSVTTVKILASFGGLLMSLEGEKATLQGIGSVKFELDKKIYLLIKKD